jgi:CheY-like chemotaxis protein
VSAEDRYPANGNRVIISTLTMAYVLVVDDEESIRRLLTRWLEGWGYQAKEAGNANEALELMSAEPAAIMLCDVMMPVHDGIWLTEQVRTRWPETAVIMASSAQDMETVMKMRKQGAVDYVTKPFGREMLRQALQRASERLSS